MTDAEAGSGDGAPTPRGTPAASDAPAARAAPPAPHGAARWHPATTACLAASLAALAFWPHGAPVAMIAAALGLTAAAAAIAASAGRAAAGRWARWTVLAWLPLAVSLGLVHGLAFPEGRTVIAALGPLAVTAEGLAFAAATAARWLAVAGAVALVAALTTPAALAQAVADGPLPASLGHAVAGALLLAPAARRSAAAIAEAQRARGLDDGGPPWRRARALGPRLVPLAVAVIVDGQARAVALAARGGHADGPTTRLEALSDSPRQRHGRRAALITALAATAIARLAVLGR